MGQTAKSILLALTMWVIFLYLTVVISLLLVFDDRLAHCVRQTAHGTHTEMMRTVTADQVINSSIVEQNINTWARNSWEKLGCDANPLMAAGEQIRAERTSGGQGGDNAAYVIVTVDAPTQIPWLPSMTFTRSWVAGIEQRQAYGD